MRLWITIGLLLTMLMVVSAGRESCRRGSVRYAVATYKTEVFIKEQYQRLFDSLLYAPTYQCFCQSGIRGLPRSLGDGSGLRVKPSMDVIVEPLMVDLGTMDGVYARRTYALRRGRRNPRFRCGYFHTLFIVADRRYYAFSRDTQANKELIGRVLQGRFPPADVARMQEQYAADYICADYTFLPPALIRRGPQLLFDRHQLADSTTTGK